MSHLFYPALALLLAALPWAAPAQSGPEKQPPEPAQAAAWAERLRELQGLLQAIESLEVQLLDKLQELQRAADVASDYDSRRRYEQLAAETGARLAELRTARRNLEDQIQRLEQVLSGLSRIDSTPE